MNNVRDFDHRQDAQAAFRQGFLAEVAACAGRQPATGDILILLVSVNVRSRVWNFSNGFIKAASCQFQHSQSLSQTGYRRTTGHSRSWVILSLEHLKLDHGREGSFAWLILGTSWVSAKLRSTHCA